MLEIFGNLKFCCLCFVEPPMTNLLLRSQASREVLVMRPVAINLESSSFAANWTEGFSMLAKSFLGI